MRDIVILASDGASTLEKELVEAEAQKLIDNGIRTFAIGTVYVQYNVYYKSDLNPSTEILG